jgi:hypothetical protein
MRIEKSAIPGKFGSAELKPGIAAPRQKNAAVAQGREHPITNRVDAGWNPARRTLCNKTGCPVRKHRDSRNRRTREGRADYTLIG